MLLQLPANHVHGYGAFILALEMKARCYRIDSIEDPLATSFLKIQFARQAFKADPGGGLAGNQLHPGLVWALALPSTTILGMVAWS